jgi:hypothetical protein
MPIDHNPCVNIHISVATAKDDAIDENRIIVGRKFAEIARR